MVYLNFEVLKFGGSCLRNELSLKRVADIINETANPVIVVSALYGITDFLENSLSHSLDEELLRSAHSLTFGNDELKREYDSLLGRTVSNLALLYRMRSKNNMSEELKANILSYGERLSAIMLLYFLRNIGFRANVLESDVLGIRTRGNILDSRIDVNSSSLQVGKKVIESSRRGIPIITGFFGINDSLSVSLLGRNGSDYTAAFVASSINAKKIVLYKDTPGLLTADPKIVPNARAIRRIGYQKALEVAKGGARIVNSLAISQVRHSGRIIEIRNFESNSVETRIGNYSDRKVFSLGVVEKVEAFEISNKASLSTFNVVEAISSALPDYSSSPIKMICVNDSLVILFKNEQRAIIENIVDIYSDKNGKRLIEDLSLVTIVHDKADHNNILETVNRISENLGTEIFCLGLSKSGFTTSIAIRERDPRMFTVSLHELMGKGSKADLTISGKRTSRAILKSIDSSFIGNLDER